MLIGSEVMSSLKSRCKIHTEREVLGLPALTVERRSSKKISGLINELFGYKSNDDTSPKKQTNIDRRHRTEVRREVPGQ